MNASSSTTVMRRAGRTAMWRVLGDRDAASPDRPGGLWALAIVCIIGLLLYLQIAS